MYSTYLAMAVMETAKPLMAPSLSNVTELLMKRILEANPAEMNTIIKYFIAQSITQSNQVLNKKIKHLTRFTVVVVRDEEKVGERILTDHL